MGPVIAEENSMISVPGVRLSALFSASRSEPLMSESPGRESRLLDTVYTVGAPGRWTKFAVIVVSFVIVTSSGFALPMLTAAPFVPAVHPLK